ncbi:MAG: ribbon-helix-helix domain-containing protein [Candidatus Diapherotrites archaeon]|nr:ribbon-helix-helix domain-containing protein [Candidatus Diapherotrites archaeon]
MSSIKETVLSIRIDKRLLDELDDFSNKKKSTRAEFIREALETFVDDVHSGEEDQCTEDFVNARIDEKAYLEYFKFTKVPEDILQLRKENLTRFKNKSRGQ